MVQSTLVKTHSLGPLLDVEMSKKFTAFWRAKMLEGRHVRTTFRRFRCNGFHTFTKLSSMCGFSSKLNNDGMRGTFEEDVPGCMSCGRGNTRDISSRQVQSQGAAFLRGIAFRTLTSSGLLHDFE